MHTQQTLVCKVVNSVGVALHWQPVSVEHLLVQFMETGLPCSVTHHHYACVIVLHSQTRHYLRCTWMCGNSQ